MDLSQNENYGRKAILLVFIFLIGLALGIFASAIFFQKKMASLQSQIVSLQNLGSPKCPSSQGAPPDYVPPSPTPLP